MFLKVVFLLGVMGIFIASQSASARPWTNIDTVELSKITAAGQFNPARTKFLAVTSKGVVRTNEVESTLWIFDSAEVDKYLCSTNAERAKLTFPGGQIALKASAATHASDTNHPATISDLMWSNDGKKVFFTWRGAQWEKRLFEYDVNSRQVSQLSLDGQDVGAYAISQLRIVYAAKPSANRNDIYQAGANSGAPDIVSGVGYSQIGLIFPNWIAASFDVGSFQFWKVEQGKPSPILASAGNSPSSFASNNALISLSPDGRFLVTKAQVDVVPKSWEQYAAANNASIIKAEPAVSSLKTKGVLIRPETFRLIDLDRGTVTTLIDAPTGESGNYWADQAEPAWSSDSKRVAISNCFVPLSLISDMEHHLKPCNLTVDIPSKNISIISESHVKSFDGIWKFVWTANDTELQVLAQAGIQNYKMSSKGWEAEGEPMEIAQPANMKFFCGVRQSLMQPQVLVVGKIVPGRSFPDSIASPEALIILDPNPNLRDVEMAEVQKYTWKDVDGRESVGGLILPPGRKPGQKFPLLIQTHGFDPHAFLSGGYYTTANPGRAIAARGIAVLQVNEPRHSKYSGTPEESLHDGRGVYVSAIEQLAQDGLIDSAKVGLIGFSNTGWYVLDSLINQPKYFRAATMAEAGSIGLTEYLANVDYLQPNREKQMSDAVGGVPFGDGLKLWIDRCPDFNTDKIKAPLLYEAHSPIALLSWSLYPALRAQSKPVDLLYFRDGGHVESQPKLLFKSLETNTDWFDFWLNGHESSDPGKADQYQRWHELRSLQTGK